MYSTYGERKVAAFMQDRLGPNRAGPFGILQPVADGVKMFMKEEIIPQGSNKWLFILGPSIAMLTACMASAVIPWGKGLTIGGDFYSLQITDVNIGILYIFGVVSIGVYGIMIGGWASNNKYSLLGALRASSQMISYEIAMGLVHYCSGDDDRHLECKGNYRTTSRWTLECLLSTTWIFDFPHLCFCRNQPNTI